MFQAILLNFVHYPISVYENRKVIHNRVLLLLSQSWDMGKFLSYTHTLVMPFYVETRKMDEVQKNILKDCDTIVK
jgi:hypothetical protein